MSDILRELTARVRTWAEAAAAEGWLLAEDVARCAALECGRPADLFAGQAARPLVVALFGGTGVGKSSLLNRLAKAQVARVGVERPTSREVTLYVHESVALADLPAELPVHVVRVERHAGEAFRGVLWIDAPDIDSTEEQNRQAALAWLPHVDLVCYVVSPERYRDDAGWRVLHSRGCKHGWAFIINRWDEGDPRQVDDLSSLLTAAGFAEPLVLRTCCRPGSPVPDDFARLREVVTELLAAQGVLELERVARGAHGQELREALAVALRRLGSEETWEGLAVAAKQHWARTTDTLATGLEWAMQAAAQRAAAHEQTLFKRLRGAVAPASLPGSVISTSLPGSVAPASLPVKEPPEGPGPLTSGIWDEWATGKVQACLNALEVHAGKAGLAAAPWPARLAPVADRAATDVITCLEDHVRSALARPGDALRRMARRGTGFLMTFLPAVAVLWVAYAALTGYHAATRGSGPFFGTSFAVHSAVVVLLAWLVPFLLDRWLRPSTEQTVLRALRAGLRNGLRGAGAELEAALSAGLSAARRWQKEGAALDEEAARFSMSAPGPGASVVARLVKKSA